MEKKSAMLFKEIQTRKLKRRNSNSDRATPKIALVKPKLTREYISGSSFLTDVTPDLIKKRIKYE